MTDWNIRYIHKTVHTEVIGIRIPGCRESEDQELHVRYTDLSILGAGYEIPQINFCMGSYANGQVMHGMNIMAGEPLDALITTLQEFQEKAKGKR